MPELRVRREDPAECELVDGEPRRDDLAEGEAQLRVERFALSANNLTYATMGNRLGYWQLFPAAGGWGCIPAWGVARVLSSRSEAVEEGGRYFGLVPMGTHVTIRPAARGAGFSDEAPHRAALSRVYNRYLPAGDELDDAALVLRPLFGTSLVLDIVLGEAGLAADTTVVLTSASSKTAYGLAHLLRARPVRVAGLTSASHREWVEGLGLYDAVLSYDELDRLPDADPVVLVDFAGDRALLHRLHERLGGALARSISVGFAHRRDDDTIETELPGPAHEFFFAPDEMVRRGRELAQRYVPAWLGYAPFVERAMRIERVTTGEELVRVYRTLFDGRVDPAVGYVVALGA